MALDPIDETEPLQSQLQTLLAQVSEALAAGQLELARRYADAARRRAPESLDVLRLNGKLLLRCGEAEPALAAFEQAAQRLGRADHEADCIQALIQLGRHEEARARLASALCAFAVDPGDALALAARRSIRGGAGRLAAWAGLSSSGELWGEAARGADPPQIEVSLDQVQLERLHAERTDDPRLGAFRFPVPPARGAGVLAVLADGEPALGSGLVWPAPMTLDGRAALEEGEVRGWVELAWAPQLPLMLQTSDVDGREAEAPLTEDPEIPGRRRFAFDPARLGLQGAQIRLCALTPQGDRLPMPGGPVLREVTLPPRRSRMRGLLGRALSRSSDPGEIAVIVPAYRGVQETLACLASVRDTVSADVELIVVDDASPEPELSAALDGLVASGAITLLRNEQNLGFPGAVNRGLEQLGARDAVIVNADAQVFPGWLERLHRAAYSARNVGTVTPLTNCGSIASFVAGDGRDVTAEEAAELSAIAARVNHGLRVDAPTGVGFCLYVRGECLKQTGLLDTASFERGYGEENDFCMRAARLGWRHLIAADVLVRHLGARSFGPDRAALQERNAKILSARHPDYDDRVQAFLAADPLRPARRRIAEARLEQSAQRYALIVTLDLPGGVDRMVRRRCEDLRAEGLEPIVARPDAAGGVRFELEAGGVELAYRLPEEADEALAMLQRSPVERIELHHFLGLQSGFVDRLLGLGLPLEAFLHDHAMICPRLSLLGGDGAYCGEPELAACEACVRDHGSSLGEDISVADLRARSARWLGEARAVTAPSQDLARRFQRHFPDLRIEVTPWEPDPGPRTASPVNLPTPGEGVIRVAVVGAIGEQKGYQVLLACAKDAAARALPLEFALIGYSEDDAALAQTGKVFVTGRYDEPEIARLLEREAPHLGLLPSVTPETWCFSLTHLLRAGLAVTAFDLGAVAERLRSHGGPHQLIPLGCDAQDINDRLIRTIWLGWPANTEQPCTDLAQPQPRHDNRDDQMPQLLAHGGQMESSQGGLNTSVEVLNLSKGLFMFSVKSAAPRRVGEDGELVLPAVHVGPGPGVAAGQFEVMQGLRTEGAWLYDPRDVLIVKVKASPTLVLLTSVRAEGMASLEMAVERLDGRRAVAAAEPLEQQAPARPRPEPPAPSTLAQLASSAPARGLRTEILLHHSGRGDVRYADTLWAGALGERLPIESFCITPLEELARDGIEYRGLTAKGEVTPWIGGGEVCGTQGQGVPLLGFAVRLSPELAGRYDCEYRGAFRSGRIVGPLSNGAPCQARASDDYLEGVQLTLIEREASQAALGDEPAPAARPIGPRFSVFREEAR
jgi:GT2 family glycosyltransferase/glycosyltransferase involved in cell wall biosynthesis